MLQMSDTDLHIQRECIQHTALYSLMSSRMSAVYSGKIWLVN